MKFNVSASRSVLALIAALAGTTAANAAIIQYSATLNGPNEAPPVNSAGVGTSLLTYDTVARTYRIEITFSGLTGTTSACHIHGATAAPFAGTAGVMSPTPTYPGFLNGVRAGSYDRTFDMTHPGSWGSGFLTARGGSTAAAETFFINSLNDGKAYLNIHTSFAGGGEIRGFYTLVPTPGSLAVIGLAGLAAARRRRAR